MNLSSSSVSLEIRTRVRNASLKTKAQPAFHNVNLFSYEENKPHCTFVGGLSKSKHKGKTTFHNHEQAG